MKGIIWKYQATPDDPGLKDGMRRKRGYGVRLEYVNVRYGDGTGVGIVLSPPPAHSTAH